MNINEEIKYDISVKCGADFEMDCIYAEDDETPIDMSGWVIESQLREFPEARDYFTFTASADESGIHLFMPYTDTLKIPYTRGVYDIFMTSPDNATRVKLISGRAFVEPRSTR